MQSISKNTTIIKQTAQKLGFDFCGISKAEFLAEEAPRLEAWLKKGNHAEMGYMENHFDKRLDPSKLVPGAKSVVSLLYNYYPEKDLAEEHPEHLKLAKYAYGEDYHFVIKDRLKTFMSILKEEIGDVEGRVFVDSAPVMERQWAAKSGLGWLGKNTLLINKGQGSYFFLAELITPYEVDANKCISYLTIELKDQIPDTFQGKMDNWVFGCDICQEVCPWNRFSKPHSEPTFHPKNELLELFNNNWQDLTEEVFRSVFKGSAVKRTKLEGLKRNIKMAKK